MVKQVKLYFFSILFLCIRWGDLNEFFPSKNLTFISDSGHINFEFFGGLRRWLMSIQKYQNKQLRSLTLRLRLCKYLYKIFYRNLDWTNGLQVRSLLSYWFGASYFQNGVVAIINYLGSGDYISGLRIMARIKIISLSFETVTHGPKFYMGKFCTQQLYWF